MLVVYVVKAIRTATNIAHRLFNIRVFLHHFLLRELTMSQNRLLSNQANLSNWG